MGGGDAGTSRCTPPRRARGAPTTRSTRAATPAARPAAPALQGALRHGRSSIVRTLRMTEERHNQRVVIEAAAFKARRK